MSLPAGSGVVVTGAAGGIGAALARRLAAEGMRLVIADVDEVRLAAVADAIGAYAVPGDCASADGVASLIDRAGAQLTEIDAFFANAGIIGGAGLDTTDEQWAATIEVNVMAHVRAARLLLPGWIERGHGRFVVTASAAGLLSMIDAAPYSVTKHAAVAFAEWLSITYGDKGIVVQALCPEGVRTAMLDESGHLAELLSAHGALEPDDVATIVWEALQDNRFLILPHPKVADYYRFRAADTDAWLAGMRRLQAGVDHKRDAAAGAVRRGWGDNG